MAPRPFWKGYLKLSLVTCRVAMTPATSEAEKLRFHTLNRVTGNRAESRYIDQESGKPVDKENEIKAYQAYDNKYVILEDEEFDGISLSTIKIIDVEMFIPRSSVQWIWYDTPHYLTPDEPVAEEAFAVIREAMAAANVVGIAKLVLYRRERAILLQPRGAGIVVWTLRYGDEVRDPDGCFGSDAPGAADPQLLALATRLIVQRKTGWDPALVQDPVQSKLRELIAAKRRRKPAKRPEPKPSEDGKVVSIMDALRQSLAKEKPKPGSKAR